MLCVCARILLSCGSYTSPVITVFML